MPHYVASIARISEKLWQNMFQTIPDISCFDAEIIVLMNFSHWKLWFSMVCRGFRVATANRTSKAATAKRTSKSACSIWTYREACAIKKHGKQEFCYDSQGWQHLSTARSRNGDTPLSFGQLSDLPFLFRQSISGKILFRIFLGYGLNTFRIRFWVPCFCQGSATLQLTLGKSCFGQVFLKISVLRNFRASLTQVSRKLLIRTKLLAQI